MDNEKRKNVALTQEKFFKLASWVKSVHQIFLNMRQEDVLLKVRADLGFEATWAQVLKAGGVAGVQVKCMRKTNEGGYVQKRKNTIALTGMLNAMRVELGMAATPEFSELLVRMGM